MSASRLLRPRTRWVHGAMLLVVTLVANAVAQRYAAAQVKLTATDQAKECLRLCNPDAFECNEGMVACLIKVKHPSVAVDVVQKLLVKRPGRHEYRRLLAYAQLAAGQSDQALKTLAQNLQDKPDDCPTRSMVGWIHFRSKRLDLVKKVLDEPRCPRSPPERARWSLMRAYIAALEGDIFATQDHLVEAEKAGVFYAEDKPLWLKLLRKARPNVFAPMQLNLDVGIGATTNASGSFPVAGVPEDEPAAQMTLAASGTVTGPARWFIRPRIEGGIVASLLENFDEVDVSNADAYVITARPGILTDVGRVTIDLSYRFALAMLKGPNPITGIKPTVATETHRGELDVMLPRGFTLVSGFGRGLNFARSRSRWEFNGGGGWQHVFTSGHNLALAGSFHYYSTESDRVLQYGGTLAANWGFPLGSVFVGRLNFGWRHEYFPNAPAGGGYMSYINAGAVLWANLWKGGQLGLRYGFIVGTGTTDALIEFSQHNLALAARWNISWDPWAPKVAKPPKHVTIDYALDKPPAYGRDVRVQDLLRVISVPQQSR